jgi:hypothetical protein
MTWNICDIIWVNIREDLGRGRRIPYSDNAMGWADRSSNPGKRFPHFQTLPDRLFTPRLYFNAYPGSLLGGKRPERHADHSLPIYRRLRPSRHGQDTLQAWVYIHNYNIRFKKLFRLYPVLRAKTAHQTTHFKILHSPFVSEQIFPAVVPRIEPVAHSVGVGRARRAQKAPVYWMELGLPPFMTPRVCANCSEPLPRRRKYSTSDQTNSPCVSASLCYSLDLQNPQIHYCVHH